MGYGCRWNHGKRRRTCLVLGDEEVGITRRGSPEQMYLPRIAKGMRSRKRCKWKNVSYSLAYEIMSSSSALRGWCEVPTHHSIHHSTTYPSPYILAYLHAQLRSTYSSIYNLSFVLYKELLRSTLHELSLSSIFYSTCTLLLLYLLHIFSF